MEDAEIHCPKCQAPMEQGFVVDKTYGESLLASKSVAVWAPGAPQKSFFYGTRLPKNSLPVGTYRCMECGFLESFAHPKFAAKARRQFSLRELFYALTVVALLLGLIAAVARM